MKERAEVASCGESMIVDALFPKVRDVSMHHVQGWHVLGVDYCRVTVLPVSLSELHRAVISGGCTAPLAKIWMTQNLISQLVKMEASRFYSPKHPPYRGRRMSTVMACGARHGQRRADRRGHSLPPGAMYNGHAWRRDLSSRDP